MGRINCEVIKLKIKANTAVTPINEKNEPKPLFSAIKGVKAAIEVSTPKITGVATSLTPFIAASLGH